MCKAISEMLLEKTSRNQYFHVFTENKMMYIKKTLHFQYIQDFLKEIASLKKAKSCTGVSAPTERLKVTKFLYRPSKFL